MRKEVAHETDYDFSDDGNEDLDDGDVCDCSGEAGQ